MNMPIRPVKRPKRGTARTEIKSLLSTPRPTAPFPESPCSSPPEPTTVVVATGTIWILTLRVIVYLLVGLMVQVEGLTAITTLCSPFAAVVVSLRVWVTITRESRVAVASGSVAVTACQLRNQAHFSCERTLLIPFPRSSDYNGPDLFLRFCLSLSI
jgi:hypothetical protein